MKNRCPCGFPRQVCWRCTPPEGCPEEWLDALRDMDEEEDKGKEPNPLPESLPNDD